MLIIAVRTDCKTSVDNVSESIKANCAQCNNFFK